MITVMSTKTHHIALMQAQDFATATGGTVPEWIHLIPADAEIMTQDNRGPYRVVDPQSVVASLVPGQKLPVDENHAIDWAAPRGEPSPARGYIVELQSRDSGIWGRVEWTEAGKALMSDRAYIGISPAIVHDGQKRIIGIARASLTNKPNLRGLTTLHMETDMDLSALAKALGLAEDADMEAILAAIGKLKSPNEDHSVELQSQLGQIGIALGVAENATPDAILAAAKTKSDATPSEITALQSELSTLATELKSLKDGSTREKAVAFVDAAIKEGRVGVKPVRDRYISMHMSDPEGTAAIIEAMPMLGPDNRTVFPTTPTANGEIALQSAHLDAARHLGIDKKAYAEALKAEHEEIL